MNTSTGAANAAYLAHGLSAFALAPIRTGAFMLDRMIASNPMNPMAWTHGGRTYGALTHMFERATRQYEPRPFDLGVPETIVWERPFCIIKRFGEKTSHLPKLLIVAPLSGHYATLLRDTVRTFISSHQVFVTDWRNARDVPIREGGFGLDDYIDYMIEAFRELGPDLSVLAICQPGVPVAAAISVMEAKKDPFVPANAILMGSPIDVGASPTDVNRLAQSRGVAWFGTNCVARVPFFYKGAGRRVYPGFLQLMSFMSMNLDRHISAHVDLFHDVFEGNDEAAGKKEAFYDEYLTVMDLPAEFYLETVERIFIENRLARGRLEYRGLPVDPTAIRSCRLLAIEGEKDDITGQGQTRAILDLAINLDADKKAYHLQKDVGHYGLFAGRRFRDEIAPAIRHFIGSAKTAKVSDLDVA